MTNVLHKLIPIFAYAPQIISAVASVVMVAAIIILFLDIRKLFATAEKSIAISQKMVKLHLIDNLELHKLTVERVALLRLYAEAANCKSLSEAEKRLYEVICETELGEEYYLETIATIKGLRDEFLVEKEEGH